MERFEQIQPHIAKGPIDEAHAAGAWANSAILYLLTCYDVWSATPPRGCEPTIAHPDEEMRPAV